MFGAAISGTLGGLVVLGLRHLLRIREDAALGIVLSTFFGAGVALIGVVMKMPGGNASGLEDFIYGKTAAMTIEDAWLSGSLAGGILLVVVLLSKELKILCFDSELAQSQGWPIVWLDLLLVGLVVVVTIIGLQAVGLIMVIALLVVPAASARFWSHQLSTILLASAAIGGLSCGIGTLISASLTKMPSGATIVLVACGFFMLSFLYGKERGVVWSFLRLYRLQCQQQQQHLLRSMWEILEAQQKLDSEVTSRPSASLSIQEVAYERRWSNFQLRRYALQLERLGLVALRADNQLQLTPRGLVIARRLVREHRLLELYFIDQTAVSEGTADRGADYLEHSLSPEIVWELDGTMRDSDSAPMPPNPHRLRSETVPGKLSSSNADSSSKARNSK